MTNIEMIQNPLATESIKKLIFKFALPATISFLVSALYNIVDQIFIGQSVGFLGNAATNIAFPINTMSTALALLIGVGSASNFSLSLGRGQEKRAGQIAGTGISMAVISGIVLAVVVSLFLRPLLKGFGATQEVLPYAITYTSIICFGLPFVIFSTACSQLIRADGSPTYSMLCVLTGAILNTLLDPILIFGFDMGMAGAAYATVIGQVASFLLVAKYLIKLKSICLQKEWLKPQVLCVKAIVSLGMAACFNQLAMTVVQITMNNTLTYYGALSPYGSEIPLACVGVISKVSIVLLSFLLGISQGCQPINGFNYGAKNYARVKNTYKTAAIAVTILSFLGFFCFQLFPRQIISIFGEGDALYFHFAEQYFRIYMFMTFLNGIQPLTGNFFTSIGKAKMGIFISMTRQIVFLLPLILIFPKFFGIDGIMYAGPIADAASFLVAAVFVWREMKQMTRLTDI